MNLSTAIVRVRASRSPLSIACLAGTVVILAGAAPALAHLGSFTPADGYSLAIYNGPANWCDVTMYNAGQYGPNSGGGSGPTNYAVNSGPWRVISQAGAFFPTTAARNAAIGGAPPYPNFIPAGTIPTYLVGDHFGGRTDNSALAFRNDTAPGTVGPAVYDYDIDTYDTGGNVPASVTSGSVSYNIYFASMPDAPTQAGVRYHQKFHQSLLDSSGNIGAQWGWALDNEIIWRDGPSSAWNYTGLYTNGGWDSMRSTLDLTSDTFMLEFYDSVGATWNTIAPAGTPMGTAMGNFTGLRWQLEDGINAGLGGKNFFDDASFSIPSPSAVALLGCAAFRGSRRRRV